MDRRQFIGFSFSSAVGAAGGGVPWGGPAMAHAQTQKINAIQSAQILTNFLASPSTDAKINAIEGLRDGVVGGYGGNPPGYQYEWLTEGMRSSKAPDGSLIPANAMVHLRWYSPIPIDEVVLFDRPNLNDRVLSGRIVLDKGPSIPFKKLNNAAEKGLSVAIGGQLTQTLTVIIDKTSEATQNIGLSELKVFSSEPGVNANVELPIFQSSAPGSDQLFNLAWQYAAAHIKYNVNMPQPRYMDEACYDNGIWPWDTMFMAMYCKYAPKMMPGVESLENFYRVLHDGETIQGVNLWWVDNPPLYAWAEYHNVLQAADAKRLKKLLVSKQWLAKEFDRRSSVRVGDIPTGAALIGNGSARFFVNSRNYWELNAAQDGVKWNRYPSGMDNTPRADGIGEDHIYWVDALAQHGLSALYISRLFRKHGDAASSDAWKAKHRALAQKVQTLYWNDSTGFFYDRKVSYGSQNTPDALTTVETVAGFWPLLAEMATETQARRLVDAFKSASRFGGRVPFPSLSRSDPRFDGIANNHSGGRGDYWRGGIWMPTSYMAIKGLEKYGFMQEAKDAAKATNKLIVDTFNNPQFPRDPNAPQNGGTIWECYSPDADVPSTENGRTARIDFCGWSALGPISMQIENCLGLYRIDGFTRTVFWWWDGERNIGASNLGMMKDTVASFKVNANGTITVDATKAFRLVLNGFIHPIVPGPNQITAPVADDLRPQPNRFAELSVALQEDVEYTVYNDGGDGTRRVWDCKDGADTAGTPVRHWPSNGSRAQRFKLKRGDGLFQLESVVAAGLVVGTAGSGGDIWMSQDTNRTLDTQQYTIVGNRDQGYLIRVLGSNNVVTRMDGDQLRPAAYDPNKAASQRWHFQITG